MDVAHGEGSRWGKHIIVKTGPINGGDGVEILRKKEKRGAHSGGGGFKTTKKRSTSQTLDPPHASVGRGVGPGSKKEHWRKGQKWEKKEVGEGALGD